jgi:lysozyme
MPYHNRVNIQELPSFPQTEDFIKKEEELRLDVYLCPAGVKTAGWGHAVEPHDSLNLGDVITLDRAAQFLESDLVKAYQALFRLVHAPLTNNQQTALVSFIFNFGSGGLQASTLRQKLNRQEYKAAALEFERWVYVRDPIKGLVKSRGLIARRKREKMLFLLDEPHGMPLNPHPNILPFKPHKPQPPVRMPSIFQKAATVCMGLFKAG